MFHIGRPPPCAGNGSVVSFSIGPAGFRYSLVQFQSQEGLRHGTKMDMGSRTAITLNGHAVFFSKITIGFECQLLIANTGTMEPGEKLYIVIPAKAGIRGFLRTLTGIPAFAGMTN